MKEKVHLSHLMRQTIMYTVCTSSLKTSVCKCEREGAFITLDALGNNVSSLKSRVCKCEREGAFIMLDASDNNVYTSSLKTESVNVKEKVHLSCLMRQTIMYTSSLKT